MLPYSKKTAVNPFSDPIKEYLIVSRESAMMHSALYIHSAQCCSAATVQIYCTTTGNHTAKWCRCKLDIGGKNNNHISSVETNCGRSGHCTSLQAFVEIIFSFCVCGLLTKENYDRMTKSIEMRICLKKTRTIRCLGLLRTFAV